MSKRWTYEEDQIVRANLDEMSADICKLLPDRTLTAIKRRVYLIKKNEEKRQDLISVWDQRFWVYVAGIGAVIPEGQNMKENYEKVCNMMMERNASHERGIDVLNLYFKFGLSWEEIAHIFNVSRERIRQIFNKYIRLMRLRYMYVLEHGEPRPRPESVSESVIVPEHVQSPESISGNDKIDVLNLSVRAYNVLKRGGINTIDQLINTPKDDLMRLRNMGTKPMQEIETVLNKYGFALNK